MGHYDDQYEDLETKVRERLRTGYKSCHELMEEIERRLPPQSGSLRHQALQLHLASASALLRDLSS